MEKIKVLFVCIHNSARSQIAETYLNHLAGDRFIAESAGLEPGTLNPLVIEVMKEAGFDISNNKTKSVFDFYKQGKKYEYVVTVCDEAAGQACPIFPGLLSKTIHWSFEDPSSFEGTYEEKLQKTRIVRDQIKSAVEQFIKEHQG
ncbi:MAG: arsenate reductase [Elusimicrobia bacterium RIFOXYA2_FULL_40_6]|nr:MAG: arsenate reductase [Elusimicrobia bacterium RIFOXYA2_FULL_40_6]